MNTKRCPKCKTFNPTSKFDKDRTKKDGYHSACKDCVRTYKQGYRQTEKGKESQKRRSEKKRAKFPKRIKARQILNYAVQRGKIPRPESINCACKQPAKEYHHHKGYEPEHWLDVVALCSKCHKKADKGTLEKIT